MQSLGKQICDSGQCFVSGRLSVRRDISNQLEKEENKELRLNVMIFEDDLKLKYPKYSNQTCHQMRTIGTSEKTIVDVNPDGSQFELQVDQQEKQKIQFLYLLDCDQVLANFGQPKTWYEIDFIQIFDNFKKDIVNKKMKQISGQTHFGQDQKWLSTMFFIAFLIFSVLNYTQAMRVLKDFQNSTIRWHIVMINISTLLISSYCFLNWLHLVQQEQDGNGLPFLNWSGDLLENMADIIITTMLLCMATGWLSKFGTKLEADLVIPLAMFAALFNLLIFTVDFVTDTDAKFFSNDSWIGWVVSIIKCMMALIFHILQSNTFADKQKHGSDMSVMKNFLNSLQIQGLIYFLHWPAGYMAISIQSKQFPANSLLMWHVFRVVLNYAVIQVMNQMFTENTQFKNIIENNSGALGAFE